MRAWHLVFLLLPLLLLLLVTRPQGPPTDALAGPTFEVGETWQYHVTEQWQRRASAGAKSWDSTVRVLATDVPSSTTSVSLLETRGEFLPALLGPGYETENYAALTNHLVDAGGWTWIGAAVRHDWTLEEIGRPTIGPSPCDDHYVPFEFHAPDAPRFHLVPTIVLNGGAHHGTWEYASQTWTVVVVLLEETTFRWGSEDVPAAHLSARLNSADRNVETNIDYWYSPHVDGILRAERVSRDARDLSDVLTVNATLELSSHVDASPVEQVKIASREFVPPEVGSLDIASSAPGPLNLSGEEQSVEFHLTQLEKGRRTWDPPEDVEVLWTLIFPSRVASQQSTGRFNLTDPGAYEVQANLRAKECLLGPWTSSITRSELVLLERELANYWEDRWQLVMDPGGGEREVAAIEVLPGASRVVGFADRVGATPGTPSDTGRLVLRSLASNEFVLPHEDVVPGPYKVIWQGQGPAGGPVIGDDWLVGIQVLYAG